MDEVITNEKYNEIEIHEMQEAKSFQKLLSLFSTQPINSFLNQRNETQQLEV